MAWSSSLWPDEIELILPNGPVVWVSGIDFELCDRTVDLPS